MSSFDKIGASSPVNKQAAMSWAQGRDVKSIKKIQTADSQDPLPTRPLMHDDENLIGFKFGRFTVVGRAIGPRKNGGSPWVVRCACSVFSIRRSKSIKNPNNQDDRCEECRHNAHLRRTSKFRTVGKNTDNCHNPKNGGAA